VGNRCTRQSAANAGKQPGCRSSPTRIARSTVPIVIGFSGREAAVAMMALAAAPPRTTVRRAPANFFSLASSALDDVSPAGASLQYILCDNAGRTAELRLRTFVSPPTSSVVAEGTLIPELVVGDVVGRDGLPFVELSSSAQRRCLMQKPLRPGVLWAAWAHFDLQPVAKRVTGLIQLIFALRVHPELRRCAKKPRQA